MCPLPLSPLPAPIVGPGIPTMLRYRPGGLTKSMKNFVCNENFPLFNHSILLIINEEEFGWNLNFSFLKKRAFWCHDSCC